MFENAKWICLEHGENAPWKGDAYLSEEADTLVGQPGYQNCEYGSILFRREFTLDDQTEQATLAISGLGYYEVFINGRKPDERRVLTPIVSSYFKEVRYDVYDVTELLHTGVNVIAVEVCGGWFSGREKFWGWQQIFHGNPRMIAQLDVKSANGAVQTITSDTENWRTIHGAVERSCVYDGEIVDLNRVMKGWNFPGFDTEGWRQPEEAEAPTDNMVESVAPPVRVIDVLTPINSWKLSDTQIVYDFGVNGSGLPLFEVCGKRGDQIIVNVSEYIYDDGTLNEHSCWAGGAINTDSFTLTGAVNDVCQPRFTWHGYRYCMVTLSSPEIRVIKAEKHVIHSDVKTTGHFACSDPEINRLHEAYVRTQLACLMGIPVDCNQRGERLGWMGDAGVTAEECLYNFDMRDFYRSYLSDMRTGRSPSRKTMEFICPSHRVDDSTSIDWNLAYPVILTECYDRYGDISLLAEHYQTLVDHTEYYVSLSDNGAFPQSHVLSNGKVSEICWFGDWFTLDFPEGTEKVVFKAGSDNHRQNPSFSSAMFYIWLLRLTAQAAELLGKNEDALRYRMLRDAAIKVLREKHYDREKHILGSGGQFLQTFALAEHIAPENEREAVFANLLAEFEQTDYHMVMGIFGVRLIADVLTSFGREDVLFKLLTAKGYPSPLHMIANGQTTLAEDLDGISGSGCHCMFASPDAALYKVFGGIQVNRRGKTAIQIRPYCPEEWEYVESEQEIAEGTIRSCWRRIGGKIAFTFSIPEKCGANVCLRNNHETVEGYFESGNYCYVL